MTKRRTSSTHGRHAPTSPGSLSEIGAREDQTGRTVRPGVVARRPGRGLQTGLATPRNRPRLASMSDHGLDVLARGLRQAADLLAEVSEDQLAEPTPCQAWSVAELVDHLVAAPSKFARAVRGEHVDWSAPAPHVGPERVEVFRADAEDLLAAWRALGSADELTMIDWQSAEIAVHTWDLATSLGRSTNDLDPTVAERGLAFMRTNLTPENRSPAFGPEQPAPDEADPYQRIAAFAGRLVHQ